MRNLSDLFSAYGLSVDRIEKIANFLHIDIDLDVVLIECDTIYEFHQVTGKPYHIGAIYVDGVILTQPFSILRQKGVFQSTIEHELLHHLINRNFSMPDWLEEGLILYLTGTKIEDLKGPHKDALSRFMREVSYEDIPNYVARYRNSNCSNHDPGFQLSSETRSGP
ncbi:MAG TPA: hypothetical protein PLP64_08900 [Pseudothermotoga sp.]|nr:hypothetical protein [Pseudothermotoga sp.]HOK84326.1 hypothetical protein [Pseudothermotoga sp.]HPP70738.1 hypothetical protein [Pseudothermotoga sp.]